MEDTAGEPQQADKGSRDVLQANVIRTETECSICDCSVSWHSEWLIACGTQKYEGVQVPGGCGFHTHWPVWTCYFKYGGFYWKMGSSEAQSHDQYVFQNCIPAPMGKEN